MTTTDDYLARASAEAMQDDELAKVTVYLTRGSMNAMIQASESTGDSRTDVINRALHLYAALVDAEAGASFSFDRAPDGPRPDEGRLPRIRRVAVVQ